MAHPFQEGTVGGSELGNAATQGGCGAEELERGVCLSQDDVLWGLLRLEKLPMT